MKTKVLADFQICISAPLKKISSAPVSSVVLRGWYDGYLKRTHFYVTRDPFPEHQRGISCTKMNCGPTRRNMFAFYHEQVVGFGRQTYAVYSISAYWCPNLTYWLSNISGAIWVQKFIRYRFLGHIVNRSFALGQIISIAFAFVFNIWTRKHIFYMIT